MAFLPSFPQRGWAEKEIDQRNYTEDARDETDLRPGGTDWPVCEFSPGGADSLWERRDPYFANLFWDRKARRVGDILTINIVEVQNFQGTENRKLEKDTTVQSFHAVERQLHRRREQPVFHRVIRP